MALNVISPLRTPISHDSSWLHTSGERREPTLEHLTFWTLRGPSGRDITCAAYRTGTGLELRVEYGPNELAHSELFRGPDADERLAERADIGRRTLLAKGFKEIARL